MQNHRTFLHERLFQAVINDNYFRIAHPTISANNFEPKPTMISRVQQNQYGRSLLKDPNMRLEIFIEICEMVKINGVIENGIRLHLLTFSFRDKAREWLQSLQLGSTVT